MDDEEIREARKESKKHRKYLKTLTSEEVIKDDEKNIEKIKRLKKEHLKLLHQRYDDPNKINR